MSKKTRKKSSKTLVRTPARAKSRKSATAKSSAGKAPATRKPAAPKVAKAKAAKAKAVKAKAKTPAKTARPTPAPARPAMPSKTKPTATKASKKNAAKTVSKPDHQPLASPPPAIAAESIRHSGPLAEGMTIPNFKLPRDGGEIVSLTPRTGRSLVIFFYPRADTPGCTKEAMDFSRLSDAFDSAQTDVVGISADPLKAQEAFRNKHELKVPLLSDEPHETLERFGVWGEKSMYGRTFFGVLRTTVVVGPDRKIRKIWHNVKVDGHAEEVLEYVKLR